LLPAPRLGAAIGLPRLWLKRDDCTGLAFGGSKVRALEYTLAEAREANADTIVTHGGVQSNHASLTAAAGARLGFRTVLFLTGPQPASDSGNLLLARLCGAEIVFVTEDNPFRVQRLIQRRTAELKAAGSRPYILPLGGATPTGVIGYVNAVAELADQLAAARLRPAAIVLAAGSMGTLAGVLLGIHRYLPGVKVWGISIGPSRNFGRRRCAELIRQSAALADIDWQLDAEEVPLLDEWIGPGYGQPAPQTRTIIRQAAQTEGVFFDPVYTGKTLAALRELANRGELQGGQTVILWHTGGLPALFIDEFRGHDIAHPERNVASIGVGHHGSSANEVMT
jgi:1-aminocyclopropane-1-carboxylate deaminase/D-cysteine desulfhydrase-like pyridoxal-dependent ACC family enzyme